MALGDVALVKRICKMCWMEYDSDILINTTLEGKSVKKLHGKCVGFLEEPCDKCKELLNKAFIVIIYDSSKSNGKDLYRTGQVFEIRKESEFVENLDRIDKERGWIYMNNLTAKDLGLPC